jgi:precorrin-2 dehydrogenase/sirohydrochlorin ferrochelatase
VNHYPLLVNLEGKGVTVIGGGAVAERKVRSVLECGAEVTVVAPEITPGLSDLAAEGSIAHEAREYRSGDLGRAALAFVAVDDAEVSAAAAKDAEAEGALVNVVDRPELCSFIVPSVLRRGPLAISVSTGGASPAWARKIRTSLEGEFGEEYARLLDAAANIRKLCFEEIPDPARRREALERLADDSLLDLARSSTVEEIEKRMESRAGLGSGET